MITAAASESPQKVREPVAAEQRTERDDDQSGLRNRVVDLEHFDRVVENRCDLLSLADAQIQESIGQPIHAGIEVGEREAGVAAHHGCLLRRVAGVV